MADVSELILGVGGRARIKGWFVSETVLVYAGMPTPETFSLAVEWSLVYNSAAYNLYYPAGRREFVLAGREVQVQSVTPEEIRLRVCGARG